MSSREVYIARVDAVRHYAGETRTVYRITLSCGCVFTEDRDRHAEVPAFGEVAQCFAGHVALTEPEPPKRRRWA